MSECTTQGAIRLLAGPFQDQAELRTHAEWESFLVTGMEAHYAAHDLRNIFAGVMLRLDAIRSVPPEEAAALAKPLQRALYRAIETCESLMHAGRPVTPETCGGEQGYVSDMIDSAIALLPLWQAERCVREVKGDIFMSGSTTPFFRALFNLIHNASRYGRVWIEARMSATSLVLCVSDDGPGLPPTLSGDPFRMGASYGVRAGSGLVIAHRLTQFCGGRLELTRTGPNGTTFTLFFPETSRVHARCEARKSETAAAGV